MEIKIQNLKKIYGSSTVVYIPELLIGSGEIIGLVGNNGAGKTTLLRLILDLIKADTGWVQINDKAVDKDYTWKIYTGSYIDSRFLIPFYTPEEFFDFVCQAYSMNRDEMFAQLTEYTCLMNGEILGTGKQIRHLSEGNKQKIGIIAAMMINPKVLILDEPFNYLDPSSQFIVSRLIKQMNKTFGTTVIISSHNLTSVADISTRILLLEKGLIAKNIVNYNDSSAIKELNDYFISKI